jgi:SMC interacting uncharacterized protein involved in chromosome segregation
VKAVGKGKISVNRLELEIEQREKDRLTLNAQYDDLQRKINDETVREYNFELVKQSLKEFQKAFDGLSPKEQAEAIRCVVKDVVLLPEKIVLQVFELRDPEEGSRKDTGWLPGQDSNLRPFG